MAKNDEKAVEPAGKPKVNVEAMLAGSGVLPVELQGTVVLREWAESLVNHEPYHEPDPDYLSRLLLLQTLTAETADKVFERSGIKKLQESIANVPGAGTGPVEFTSIYVTSSDFGEGAPCYMIFELTDLETAVASKYTTGATQLQAQVLRLISLGVWPIRGQIRRIDRKDRGGRYLFQLYPVD